MNVHFSFQPGPNFRESSLVAPWPYNVKSFCVSFRACCTEASLPRCLRASGAPVAMVLCVSIPTGVSIWSPLISNEGHGGISRTSNCNYSWLVGSLSADGPSTRKTRSCQSARYGWIKHGARAHTCTTDRWHTSRVVSRLNGNIGLLETLLKEEQSAHGKPSNSSGTR